MFKKGDKVKSLKDYGDQFTKDKIYAISIDQSNTIANIEQDDRGDNNAWIASNFELVKTSNDLQVLVETANKGFLAWQEICDRYGKESCVPASGNALPEKYINLIQIKPKPKFEEFIVRGHTVKLDGKLLRIGCKSFNASILKDALMDLTKNNRVEYKSWNWTLYATRTGIRLNSISCEECSWNDADKILASLIEAGV